MSEVAERIQEEVTEIAEVLARRKGKPIREVWTEALTLHRVRYEREVLDAELSNRREPAAVDTRKLR
jgi:acyl-CoA reductase-like NAD-dependent aldehyde dehydrogenase